MEPSVRSWCAKYSECLIRGSLFDNDAHDTQEDATSSSCSAYRTGKIIQWLRDRLCPGFQFLVFLVYYGSAPYYAHSAAEYDYLYKYVQNTYKYSVSAIDKSETATRRQLTRSH